MRKLLSFEKLRDESGGVLVFVAIFMTVLLGITAVVIDGGRLYSEKSKLQKALDAAVLAGVQGFRTSEASAREIAKDISKKNNFEVIDSELTFTSDSIKATKQVIVPMTLAKVLGINNTTVSATATAKVAPLTKASGIAPLVIEKSNIPNATVLNCGSTNPGDLQGNCGYLKSTEGNLRDALLNGSTYEVGKTVFTDPGGSVGQVEQAIDGVEGIVARDAAKPHCQSPDTADNTCARVITVVVIDGWVDVDGKKVTGTSELKVAGFASYWIEKYEDKKLYGKFIKMIAPGEIGTGTGIGEYALFGVKLVE
jgi:Flp pilus assembly protein TadG